jgi:hypothetical protein
MITAVPVSDITAGTDLFRCVPYSCTMLARACVTRQAQAGSDFPPVSLLLCKGCELGREVKARAGHVDIDPHAADRASRKRVIGLPQRRALPVLDQLPAASLPPQPAPVLAAPSAVQQSKRTEEKMPDVTNWKGKSVGGVTVLERAPSTGGGAVWHVEHKACGHEEDVPGVSLAYCEKNGSKRRCRQCRGTDKAEPKARAPKSTEPVKAAKASPAPKLARPSAPPPLTIGLALKHSFPLRRDFNVELELPSDLSKHDVQRLARWLEVLAFDEG